MLPAHIHRDGAAILVCHYPLGIAVAYVSLETGIVDFLVAGVVQLAAATDKQVAQYCCNDYIDPGEAE